LERREQLRFQIRAVAKFEWVDGGGVRHWGQGLTRDISAKGLFILTDSRPPTKADLQVEVFFSSIAGADTNLELCVQSVLLRVEWGPNVGVSSGFAVLNRSYKIANQDPMEDGEEEDLRSEPN
jgi:hypothetical protein